MRGGGGEGVVFFSCLIRSLAQASPAPETNTKKKNTQRKNRPGLVEQVEAEDRGVLLPLQAGERVAAVEQGRKVVLDHALDAAVGPELVLRGRLFFLYRKEVLKEKRRRKKEESECFKRWRGVEVF